MRKVFCFFLFLAFSLVCGLSLAVSLDYFTHAVADQPMQNAMKEGMAAGGPPGMLFGGMVIGSAFLIPFLAIAAGLTGLIWQLGTRFIEKRFGINLS